ncbi:MAG: hypothetical protein EBR40_04215 [Proteobacteria bacterium]|nr:hypothetical protein [Pseudomonadota bacterium]
MVLQRDVHCNIWGEGARESKVTLTFQGQTKSVEVDATGQWSLKLDPMTATGEGKECSVSSQGKPVTFRNVVLGDVWICAGQSNTGIPLSSINDLARNDHDA